MTVPAPSPRQRSFYRVLDTESVLLNFVPTGGAVSGSFGGLGLSFVLGRIEHVLWACVFVSSE